MNSEEVSEHFECPHCGAGYELVRVEGDPEYKYIHRQITCCSCGAPLHGREGGMVLKYFLVTRPHPGVRAAMLPMDVASISRAPA
jgi:predicted RNA-binding Zn-ribbon protein involved in translation (DUF1610 family)